MNRVRACHYAVRFASVVSLCAWRAHDSELRVHTNSTPDNVCISKVTIPLGFRRLLFLLKRGAGNAFDIHLMSNEAVVCQPPYLRKCHARQMLGPWTALPQGLPSCGRGCRTRQFHQRNLGCGTGGQERTICSCCCFACRREVSLTQAWHYRNV